MCCGMLWCVAVYCSVLQCIAVCCSVLQCVAVCCGVLQCIAVCFFIAAGFVTRYIHYYGYTNRCDWLPAALGGKVGGHGGCVWSGRG